jgi:hypothetical protein
MGRKRLGIFLAPRPQRASEIWICPPKWDKYVSESYVLVRLRLHQGLALGNFRLEFCEPTFHRQLNDLENCRLGSFDFLSIICTCAAWGSEQEYCKETEARMSQKPDQFHDKHS